MLTNDYVPGAPDWLDLGSRDLAGAADFYHALFGWEFQSMGPEAGGYGTFQLAGQTVAALGPLQDDNAEPAWTVCAWQSVQVSTLERCNDMSSLWQTPHVSMLSEPSDFVMWCGELASSDR